jgi:hypothetical protein
LRRLIPPGGCHELFDLARGGRQRMRQRG